MSAQEQRDGIPPEARSYRDDSASDHPFFRRERSARRENDHAEVGAVSLTEGAVLPKTAPLDREVRVGASLEAAVSGDHGLAAACCRSARREGLCCGGSGHSERAGAQ